MLSGRNVHLRVVERRDLEIIRAWRNSPDVSRFFAEKEQISEIQQEEWFKKLSVDKSAYYFVIEHDDQPIGVCNLKSINWVHRTATLGMYFVPAGDYHGFLPIEAAIILFDYAFSYLNLRKVYGDTMAVNQRVVEFCKGLGFKVEGVREKHVFHNGEYVDLILVGLFRQQYFDAVKNYRELVFR